jgi:hypothetical protein
MQDVEIVDRYGRGRARPGEIPGEGFDARLSGHILSGQLSLVGYSAKCPDFNLYCSFGTGMELCPLSA